MPTAPPADPAPAGPPPRRRFIDRLTSPTGLIVTAALIALTAPATSAIRDPDFWWHLRAGQLIIARGGLIPTDPFTYTVPGNHWTMHEWLTEVSFAWLHSWGGLAVIVAILSFITWIGFLVIGARARLHRPNTRVLAAGVVLGAFAGYPIWGPRVQMLTFTLTAVVLLASEYHMRNGGRRIWWLVPMYLIWSNFHSGFIIGLAFMAIIAIADLIGGRLGWSGSAPKRNAWTLLAATAVCGLAAMVNPNGPAIVLYPFATQGSAAQQALILEWHSPDLHLWEIAFFYAPMLLSLGALLAINRRIRARDAALVLATVVLSLQSVRHIALFVAAATPVWIAQADLLLKRWLERRRRGRKPRRAQLPPLPLRILVFVMLVAGIGGACAFHAEQALAVKEGSLFYAQDMPVCAARWLNEGPSGLRIFNQYGEGGYLAYTVGPHGDKIFIFGDAALMGDPLLLETSDVQDVRWDWEKILDDTHTDIVLFDTNTPLTAVLENNPFWTRVYADKQNEAFARTSELATLHLPPQPTLSSDPNDTCAQLAKTPKEAS